MMPLYLYALLGSRPSRKLRGLAGERLRAIAWGGTQDRKKTGPLFALIGEMARAPRLEEATLRAHDDAIRRAIASTEAVLPARFGTIVPDERALAEALGPRLVELTEAVALVSGREQMTLRVFHRAGTGARPRRAPRPQQGEEDSVESLAEDAARPGTRHLMRRAREGRRAVEVPGFETFRAELAPFVRAEVIERHDAPPLVASVYHLVDRGRDIEYAAAVERAARRSNAVRVRVSGPWPPYAFAAPMIAPAARVERDSLEPASSAKRETPASGASREPTRSAGWRRASAPGVGPREH